MEFLLLGTPQPQAVSSRPSEKKPAHPLSEGPGEPSTQRDSGKASGSCCNSEPVGLDYVGEVTSTQGSYLLGETVLPSVHPSVCALPFLISGGEDPRQGPDMQTSPRFSV